MRVCSGQKCAAFPRTRWIKALFLSLLLVPFPCRCSPCASTKAMLDPASAQYAADLLAQHDVTMLADALHGAAMHLSDAAAAAADGVVDISKMTGSVSGTGMTKPMSSALEVEWPVNFDPWGFWMASLKSTIFKLHDVTGSYGLSIIAIVAIVKAVTYPLNYKVYASQFEMQAIQPEIDRIKEEYADNPEIINMRTSVLFQEKEVNPLAGCLPILIQFPVFIGVLLMCCQRVANVLRMCCECVANVLRMCCQCVTNLSLTSC